MTVTTHSRATVSIGRPALRVAVADTGVRVVRSGDVAPGAVLDIMGESAAGHALDARIGPGQTARISTGAALPPGADRVVIRDGDAIGAVLTRLGALGGSARREGGWGHGHAVFRDEALAALWRPTPLDGDYLVCNRPAPVASGRRQTTRRSQAGQASKA